MKSIIVFLFVSILSGYCHIEEQDPDLAEEGVRYYSGTGTYYKTFDVPAEPWHLQPAGLLDPVRLVPSVLLPISTNKL